MTVAADLLLQHGPRRRLFLRIAGLQHALWEPVPDPPGTSIWGEFVWGVDIWGAGEGGLQCLRAPEEEWSQGLNLGTMEVAPSSLMIELDDIADPDAPDTSYFGKLFAPGRYLSGARTQIDGSASAAVVTATATSIPVKSSAAFAASGEAFIGQERFAYGSKTGGGVPSLDGCTRGLYPAVDIAHAWAGTYRRPLVNNDGSAAEVGGWRTVSQYRYSWVGSMVALYVVTWDDTTGAWHPEADAELLWVGRITGAIRYSPKRAAWQLGCESVAKDLERGVGGELPSVDLHKINLTGSVGRSFIAREHGRLHPVIPGSGGLTQNSDGVEVAYAFITLDSGFYTSTELLDAIIDKLNAAASWTNIDGTYPGRLSYGKWVTADGDPVLTAINMWTDGDRALVIEPFGSTSTPGGTGPPCHAWLALGYEIPLGGQFYVRVPEGSGGNKQEQPLTPTSRPFTAYHPLNALCNGGNLGVYAAANIMWTDQGDWGAGHPRACVVVSTGVHPDGSGDGEAKATYVAAYSAITTVDGTNALDLIEDPPYYPYVGYVGQRISEKPVKVEQRYIPAAVLYDNTERGPFALLLESLLSTGTLAYNGSGEYDVLPVGLGIGFPEALVDVQSFLDADAALGSSELTARTQYVIDHGTPWSKLLQRECQLFGFFLAWSRGKLRLKSGRADAFSTWTVTLGEAARANIKEWVTPESSLDTIVNTWHYKFDYDLAEKKYIREVTIRDAESCEGFAITKAVELEHPGIFFAPDDLADDLAALIETQLLASQETLRAPWQIVDVTLAPPYARQLAIGDVVLYESSRHPDPFGTGSMATSCLALVIDFAQSFRRWTGRAKLLICARLTVRPWAPAAVVDFGATNGGWNNTAKTLTLVARQYGEATDSKDGAAFSATDLVQIVELAPFDDNAPQTWGPLTVDKTFEADGANLLTLAAGTTLAGWPGGSAATGREFVVVPASYGDCTTTQRVRGTWQADERDRVFGNGDPAQVWG